MLGANAVLMDAYNTDVRPLLADVREEQGSTRTRWPPTAAPATPSGSWPSGSAASRPAGEREPPMARPVPEVGALLDRSHRLGADRRNTNYAGGNASAKASTGDPVTGAAGRTCCGSRAQAATSAPSPKPGWRCCDWTGCGRWWTSIPGWSARTRWWRRSTTACTARAAPAPSIDTAMHGLVDAAHVDHLHPDAGIALAAAADGEALTKQCFGDRVVWVPWRRPGFQLGLDVAAIQRADPGVIGVVLGGHGITAWGATSKECEARSLEIIRTAERFLAERGQAEPFGPVLDGYRPLDEAERHARAAALAPVLRGLASTDRRQVGHYSDAAVVLDFLARAKHSALAALGTLVPGPFPPHQGPPAGPRPAPRRPLDEAAERLRELHAAYRDDYKAYYQRHATADQPGDARR